MSMFTVTNIKGKGRGLVATSAIAKGDVIMRAPVIALDAADIVAIEDTTLGKYAFGWGDTAALALGFASLVNHASKPNCDYSPDFDDERLVVKAAKAIKKGEELTIDYGWEEKHFVGAASDGGGKAKGNGMKVLKDKAAKRLADAVYKAYVGEDGNFSNYLQFVHEFDAFLSKWQVDGGNEDDAEEVIDKLVEEEDTDIPSGRRKRRDAEESSVMPPLASRLSLALASVQEAKGDKPRSDFSKAFFGKVSGDFGKSLISAWASGDAETFNKKWAVVTKVMVSSMPSEGEE
jgi:hypothetical protein